MLNKITQGDCMKLMKQLQNNSVTMTLTDIPYGVVNRNGGLRLFDKSDADQETFDLSSFLEEVERVTAGSIYIFCSTEQVSLIRQFLAARKLTTRLCVWEKTNPSPVNGQYHWLSGIELCVYGRKKKATFNEHCKNTVFRYPSVRRKLHPTEKPFDLISRLILASSEEGDVIFDPCVGSGTTCAAAKALDRQFIGFELNAIYVAYAQQRVEGTPITVRCQTALPAKIAC